jgi:hypothetical protein
LAYLLAPQFGKQQTPTRANNFLDWSRPGAILVRIAVQMV